jgi:hypothetical protein
MEKPSCILSQEFVNKLSDFLCGEISENHKFKTKLSVIDVNTFFIIKGFTQSNAVQTLSELIDKFIESNQDTYSDLTSINVKTLDIIEYGCDDKLFNDEIISFSTKEEPQINSELSISIASKFPYGYSENYLKQTYNHLKEISCKIQPYFKFSWVELTCKLTKTDFEITSIKSDSYYTSEKLLSVLKDNYDGPIDTLLDESKLLLNLI